MRRTLLALLFGMPFLLSSSSAQAQCPSGNCGSGGMYGGGARPMFQGFYPKSHQMHTPSFGMWNWAMKMYPRIHFHGPLYNYGPYEGYYPFTPYGPWNPDLTYNSPMVYDTPGHLENLWGRLRGGIGRGGCSSCSGGSYALGTFKNILHRVNPLGWRNSGCSSCGSASLPTSGDVRVMSGETNAPVIRER